MPEQVTERIIVRADADRCWGVLTDFDHYPDWAADIKAVRIVDRDGEGRPTTVEFRAAAFGRSTTYALTYDYGGAPGRLTWVQLRGDLTRRLDGSYDLEAAGEDTEVVYRLTVELKVPLPGFVKRRSEARIMAAALRELKARAEA